MRTSAGVLSFVLVLTAFGQATSPDAFLERGATAFRSGRDYSSAVIDLDAAAQGYMAPENTQTYVNTGKFANLEKLEQALVYLALSQSRLGREGDARETILRLISAERIAPTYERLQIAEAKEFDMLVALLVPAATLPPNLQIAAADETKALPAVVAAAPVQTEEKVVTQRTVAEERAERERIIAELVAIESARIQSEANARIAEAQQKAAAAEAEAQQRITALQNETQERLTVTEAEAAARIAAAKKDAEERVAAAEAAAKRDAEARVAELQKETERRIAAEREASERAAAAQIAEAAAAARSSYVTSLRQAEGLAGKGDLDAANAIYLRLVNTGAAPREVIAEAAVGLYRTGSFRNSAAAFQRLGTFAKGEEDLRYYNAVALYETGSYQEAKKELACALPFIQVTEDVTRYRMKIEQTVSQQAMK